MGEDKEGFQRREPLILFFVQERLQPFLPSSGFDDDERGGKEVGRQIREKEKDEEKVDDKKEFPRWECFSECAESQNKFFDPHEIRKEEAAHEKSGYAYQEEYSQEEVIIIGDIF